MSDVIVYVTENETTVQITESVIETNVTVTEVQITPEVTEVVVNITPVEVTVYTGNMPDAPADDKTYGRKNNDWIEVTGGGGSDEKVKYDAGDTAAGYVVDKFIAGDGISVAEGTGADENKLVITNTDKGSDVVVPTKTSDLVNDNGFITGVDVPANETDPVFSGSEAANFVAGDKANLDNQSGVNTGDQVGDGVTITGAGTIADPFVAAVSGGGHEILDKDGTPLTQRSKLKLFQEVADDAGNDTTKVYPTFKKAGFITEYDNGNSGAAKTIDWNNGQNQKITLTADCTLTFTALSDISASTFRVQLKVIQDGTGGWNLYFPVGTIFCNGAFDFSTGTASQTCLVGIYYDGTKYYVIPTLFFD